MITSEKELQLALKGTNLGDVIVVKDGVYSDWDMEVACEGSEDSPVVIRPETPGGVTLVDESSFKISGAYVTLSGFRFEDCGLMDSCVLIDGGLSVRVTDCCFEGASGRAPVIMVRGRSVDCRVDHCRFIKPEARSVQVVVQGERSPMRTVIDHNLFQDVPPIPSGNGRETIQIGQSQPNWGWFCPLTIVEYNTFLRCDGEIEIISNKSSRNTYRYNLFKDCKGELVMRGASHCEIIGNRFENCTGGVRLSGTHHRVMDNVIVNPQKIGIQLRYGMTEELGGHYQAVGHCLIANNTIVNAKAVGLFVGSSRDRDAGEKGVSTIAPYANQIVKNIVAGEQGQVVTVDHAPDNMIVENVFYGTDEAVVTEIDGNLLDDPMFVGAEDWRLQENSPAIGMGASGESFDTGP